MPELRTTSCCGMGEIRDLSEADSPKVALQQLAYPILSRHNVFIVFTAVVKRARADHSSGGSRNDDYGTAFADYITKEKLGKVYQSGRRVNGKTGNTICVWTWETNRKAIAVWARENHAQKPSPFSGILREW